MPDSFIVTIANASRSFEVDLEIPSRVPLAEFKGKLLGILKILADYEFGGWRDCALIHKNRELAARETLANAGAFDGSRLVIVKI
jgi:hypothetical protein